MTNPFEKSTRVVVSGAAVVVVGAVVVTDVDVVVLVVRGDDVVGLTDDDGATDDVLPSEASQSMLLFSALHGGLPSLLHPANNMVAATVATKAPRILYHLSYIGILRL
ncbi:hypothetical protein EON76_05000 [bacterium]|nr:MAG: hypothetical protein EON76_05000 [bacterium]